MTDGLGRVKSIVTAVWLGQHSAMKTVLNIILLTSVLAACGPLSLYYRAGVPVARMQTDQTNCEVKALRDAPVANQIRQRPPIFFPGRQVCTSAGACYYEPGYWIDGGVYTVDVNADLRGRVLGQCMAAKGYQPVNIPPCPTYVASKIPAAQTQTLPQLTQTSCVIKNQDGSWQIVNRE